MDTRVKKIKLSEICFLLFFLLKPFYIIQSGSVQLGDLFLLLSLGCIIVEHKSNYVIKDKLFVCFVVCVIVVNFIYFSIYKASDFLKSSLYYIFNLFAIICFRCHIDNPQWLNKLVMVCKINIIIQLLLFLFSLGRYWYGTNRYCGTYNDPNQLGFALVSTVAILFLLDAKRKYLYVLIISYLIYQTSSSGMLIALMLLISFDFISNVFSFVRRGKEQLLLTLLVFFAVCMLAIYLYRHSVVLGINFDSFRLEQKLNNSNSIIQNFIEDRRLNIAVEKPLFFFIGYGEGFSFLRDGYYGEMHSTWISIFYYYGIIPFCILIKWIRNQLRGINKKYYAVYIAVFLEALTLINHRQPAFWMIIILAAKCKDNKSMNNSID